MEGSLGLFDGVDGLLVGVAHGEGQAAGAVGAGELEEEVPAVKGGGGMGESGFQEGGSLGGTTLLEGDEGGVLGAIGFGGGGVPMEGFGELPGLEEGGGEAPGDAGKLFGVAVAAGSGGAAIAGDGAVEVAEVVGEFAEFGLAAGDEGEGAELFVDVDEAEQHGFRAVILAEAGAADGEVEDGSGVGGFAAGGAGEMVGLFEWGDGGLEAVLAKELVAAVDEDGGAVVVVAKGFQAGEEEFGVVPALLLLAEASEMEEGFGFERAIAGGAGGLEGGLELGEGVVEASGKAVRIAEQEEAAGREGRWHVGGKEGRGEGGLVLVEEDFGVEEAEVGAPEGVGGGGVEEVTGGLPFVAAEGKPSLVVAGRVIGTAAGGGEDQGGQPEPFSPPKPNSISPP